MIDLVEKLKKIADAAGYTDGTDTPLGEQVRAAAVEIERLRAPIGKPIADAPRDGEQQAFEVKFNTRAFWDEESKRWVLSYPLNLEYLPSHSRYLGPARINGAVAQVTTPPQESASE